MCTRTNAANTIPVSAMTSFSVLDDGCTCQAQRPCGLVGLRGTS